MFNPWMAFLPTFAPNFMPQIRFPFSGAVNQNIAPETDWFFSAIPPSAGNGQLEKKIAEKASYGTQLDKLAEAVLDIADHVKAEDLDKVKALRKLSAQIDEVKQQTAADDGERLIEAINNMKQSNPVLLKRILQEQV